MTDSLFTPDGFWIIGADTPNPISQNTFPPDVIEFIDLVTARKYWPFLPHIDLDEMEQHHPGAKELLQDLKLALHEEWDFVDGWTGLRESGEAARVIDYVLAPVADRDLTAFCAGITEDLLTWAVSDERVSMEGRATLRKYNVQSPETLLTFLYNPAGLVGDDLDSWHGELRRSYLHWIVNNAVAAVEHEERLAQWQIEGFAAAREWLQTLQ